MPTGLAEGDEPERVMRALHRLAGLRQMFSAGVVALRAEGWDVAALEAALDATPTTMRGHAMRELAMHGYLMAGGAPFVEAKVIVQTEVVEDIRPAEAARIAYREGKWAAIRHEPETANPHPHKSHEANEWRRGYRRALRVLNGRDYGGDEG